MIGGSCLCGAVQVEVDAPLAPAAACHCSQCRKQSGHHWASSHMPRAAVRLTREDGLKWFAASDKARRGFCGTCGSFLFWDPADEDKISVSMGMFDAPTGGALARHIFTADKGDYYEIADDLPQRP